MAVDLEGNCWMAMKVGALLSLLFIFLPWPYCVSATIGRCRIAIWPLFVMSDFRDMCANSIENAYELIFVGLHRQYR